MTPEVTVLASIGLPLGATALIAAFHRQPNLRESVTLATALGLFLLNLSLLGPVLEGQRPGVLVVETLPGLSIAFEVEPLGMLFALVASGLWMVNSLYSIGYMRANREHHQTRYYVCFAVALASTMGVAFAGNLLTLFVFYEALTLSTYPLVTHRGSPAAVRAGRTYLGVLLGTSIGLLLFAILWTWGLAGTLNFAPGGILADTASDPVLGVLLFVYMFGIGKAALMPVHRWLPAAMIAPTPVSALLHAVAVVKAGVFTAVKVIVYVFGADLLSNLQGSSWLIYVAGASVILASLVALRADNLKRRLAYSTVSQLAFIVMAAAVLVPLSLIGAVLHIAAHALGKITLFFAAGSIYTASHKTEVSQLAGIGRRMPWTMAAFTVGALSMVGIPLTAGFVSKWYMLLGAIEAQQLVAIAVIILSTLLNAAYFLPIVYTAFFDAPQSAGEQGVQTGHGEAPLPVVAALTLTALGTVALFFVPELPLALAQQMVGAAP
jgi:multicomponent Na+:H+ antiporter subunit D